MNQRNESNATDEITDDAADKAALRVIRELLLAPEHETLSNLQSELERSKLSAETLSRMLPKSIEKARASGDGLSQALGPVIDGAISESIKRDPGTLADAISPIMMPAIRRSIIQMISAMAHSFNRTLEQSLSAQGIKWRIEALRTGRSFSEVAMLHSLIYRVEQVFLIHRETGLMLAHVADNEVGVMDADMVSGMLTAIQDFVHDSFSNGQQELLNTMDCGQRVVILEYGPKAILAAAVSGIAPPELRMTVGETLDNIHVEHSASLREFDGDRAPFEATHPQLTRCLTSQLQTDREANQPRGFLVKYAWMAPVTLLLGLLLWGGLRWHARNQIEAFAEATRMPFTVSANYDRGNIQLEGAAHDDWLRELPDQLTRLSWLKGCDTSQVQNLDAKWINFLDGLRREPGIVITESQRLGKSYRLAGLRDPLATRPEDLLGRSGLQTNLVHMTWAPYQSLDRPIAEQRVAATLSPPESVSLQWQDDKLIVSGVTTDRWWRTAEQRAIAILGVERVDYSQLQITNPSVDSYLQLLQQEPGIVVTSVDWHDGRIRIQGKRDKFAADPNGILERSGLSNHQIESRWSTFVSDDSIIVRRRIRTELAVPESVVVTIKDGKNRLGGTADMAWIKSLPERIEQLDVGEIDYTELTPEGTEKIVPLMKAVAESIIYFSPNSIEISEDELPKVHQVGRQIEELMTLSDTLNRHYRIRITGRTATQKPQQKLSLERVEAILGVLLSNSKLRPEIFESSWSEHDESALPTVSGDPPGRASTQRGRVTFGVIDESNP